MNTSDFTRFHFVQLTQRSMAILKELTNDEPVHALADLMGMKVYMVVEGVIFRKSLFGFHGFHPGKNRDAVAGRYRDRKIERRHI